MINRTIYKNLKLAIITIILFSSCVFAVPTEKEKITLNSIIANLITTHYSPLQIDDSFSNKVFDQYIKQLDPAKRFLTKKDIQELNKYKYLIDDEIKNEENKFFELSLSIIKKRINNVKTFYKDIIEKPFDFKKDEHLELDSEKRDYSNNENDLKILWRKIIKYQILTTALNDYEEKKKEKEKNNKALEVPVFTPKMEKAARNKVKKSLKRTFSRLLKNPRKDYFIKYVNSIAQCYDPHTYFFPPEEKEDFDIGMTGKLEGIGAVLQEDDGYIKIVRIIPGSAAYRQKILEAGDIILKVAQKNGEPVDIVGIPVREAVKYIRGKKGTLVKLNIKKPDGRLLLVPIVRDIVIIEETYAKGALIDNKNLNQQFGYIHLPSFYRDFKNKNSRNAEKDVRILLHKINQQNTNGLILDLRNNGGGSLKDAISISGHFIKMGPIVQIKNRQNYIQIQPDRHPAIYYSGPLVILINNFSASASEILAAALQDYNRAVIIGTKNSFGKGTVQTFVNLDNNLYKYPQFYKYRPLGSLKLTIQKFYRINGDSTQYKGVIPDIILPSPEDNLKSGEKNLPNAMAWSFVSPVSHSKWPIKMDKNKLREKSFVRINKNHNFSKLKNFVSKLKKIRELPQTLNFEKACKQQLQAQKDAKEIESLISKTDQIFVSNLKINTAVNTTDNAKEKEWQENIKKDLFINEAMFVLNDINNLEG